MRAIKQASWFTLNNLEKLDDVTGNTLEDIVWLGNTSDGKYFFKVEDANTATPTITHINNASGMPGNYISCIAVEHGDDDHLLVT